MFFCVFLLSFEYYYVCPTPQNDFQPIHRTLHTNVNFPIRYSLLLFVYRSNFIDMAQKNLLKSTAHFCIGQNRSKLLLLLELKCLISQRFGVHINENSPVCICRIHLIFPSIIFHELYWNKNWLYFGYKKIVAILCILFTMSDYKKLSWMCFFASGDWRYHFFSRVFG